MSDPIQNRYDISFFFDVRNGNPNGDPDAGNMPRIDPETGLGIVSDVCLKRKVRNYVELSMGDSAGYRIYVQDGVILNDRNREAYVATGIKLNKKKLPKDEEGRAVTRFMCDNFFDIRTFGAVMTTEVNCGQVRGPVQFCFSDSIDPIVPSEMSITRMAVTNEKDKAAESGRTMGRKQFVPYGLYRMNGFISAPLAEKSGFGDEDLQVLVTSLMNMFEVDRSASHGLMTSRMLFLFKHDSRLGNCRSERLFDLVAARKRCEGAPRSFSDYEIVFDEGALPEGVSVEVLS
ncbi:type I-C CRISPR-associated protein Cas7/Csd2 [Caniella muris]|uniref:type I-C CRISPR-associated protein Cas7/Csd2 n=1 Tax=Caniella muris TaxID=2941502 RepID=UPI0020402C6D|nr:type I-C CRISPR-associated protein Cas7/Csd2 [Caniella muris]